MSKLINEGLCKQLVAEYFRRTRYGAEKPAVVLRELMQITYSQGYTAAGQAQAPASPEILLPFPGGQREAIASSVKFMETKVEPSRCDHSAVSCCVRCNAVYLAKAMKKLLALGGAQS